MRDIKLSALIAKPFHAVHADARRGGHAEYWLKGGRGSGKSSFVSLEIVQGLLRDPQANAIVYRKVAATLRESVYAQIVWAIGMLGLGPWFRLGLSPMEITYHTGQRVLFRGADDPAKSKSIKLARGYFRYLWFEELTEFNGMEDIRTIKASVIRGGKRAVTFCSYNPPRSAQNWTNAEALVPRDDRLIHHSDYTQVPAEWLGPSFLAEARALREANERAYRHTYLGEVTGAGGQVFGNVALRAITESELARLDRPYYGLDHGFAVDPTALVAMRYDKRTRTLYLVGEYCKVGASYDAIATAARKLLHCEAAAITADSAEPRSNDELCRRGLRITGALKGPDSVEHGVRWLQDLGAIVIDPARCPSAAREFAGYEYEPDRNGGFKAAYPDRHNHCIDAVRYGLEPVIGRRVARVPSRAGLGI